jgi:hypothetical protein
MNRRLHRQCAYSDGGYALVGKDICMSRGLFYVETRPSAPEREADYNHWYDTVHLRDVCSVEGFVSARRYAPVDGEGPYVAMYEIEADDLEAAVQALIAVFESGTYGVSDALQADPPPVTRLLRLTTTHDPTSPQPSPQDAASGLQAP